MFTKWIAGLGALVTLGTAVPALACDYGVVVPAPAYQQPIAPVYSYAPPAPVYSYAQYGRYTPVRDYRFTWQARMARARYFQRMRERARFGRVHYRYG